MNQVKGLLPIPSDIIADEQIQLNGDEKPLMSDSLATQKAHAGWIGAIAALEEILLLSGVEGLIMTGPGQIITHPKLLDSIQRAIFSRTEFLLPLLPTQGDNCLSANSMINLPIMSGDPLALDQFCLVLTPKFSVAISCYNDLFGFSFNPDVVREIWLILRSRIQLTASSYLTRLDNLISKYPPITPNYQIVSQFAQLLLKYQPEIKSEQVIKPPKTLDMELLQAFVHEVRTPLTTIRTFTRLLLKQSDLPPLVIKRLKVIDKECTEQIDRMELIFQALELETSAEKRSPQLLATPLAEIFEHNIARWSKQASKRNLTLSINLPKTLPTIKTNPVLLDQVLTGLIENLTCSFPPGGQIQVKVIQVGQQLKLELKLEPDPENHSYCHPPKSLGKILIFQPETGNISLSLNVTKNLFESLGGRLVVRQRPQESEVFTVYLPLDLAPSH